MNNITYTPEYFLTLAKDIMIKYKLIINEQVYKICDIEFYLYTDEHKDPYACTFSDKKAYLCLGDNLRVLVRALCDINGNIITNVPTNISVENLDIDLHPDKKI